MILLANANTVCVCQPPEPISQCTHLLHDHNSTLQCIVTQKYSAQYDIVQCFAFLIKHKKLQLAQKCKSNDYFFFVAAMSLKTHKGPLTNSICRFKHVFGTPYKPFQGRGVIFNNVYLASPQAANCSLSSSKTLRTWINNCLQNIYFGIMT